MTPASQIAPSAGRRVLAVVSMLAAAVLVVTVIVFVVSNLLWLLAALVGLALAVAGVWWVLTERLPRRGHRRRGPGRRRRRHRRGPRRRRRRVATPAAADRGRSARPWPWPPWRRAPRSPPTCTSSTVFGASGAMRPRKPVLLCNPWSGGGKVEKFGLLDIAAEMGVETVLLDRGLDLAELARDAIARGADCLGMAGGDGSQALVASIAHEHDIPFVCISAGTRNHFAQDLGFDKEDPRKGMEAFRDGVERFIDYGDGGRPPVREQRVARRLRDDRAAGQLPRRQARDLEGAAPRDARPARPSRSTCSSPRPTASRSSDSFLIMVSNNPYVLGPSLDVSQRRSMDTGTLGVFAVNATSGHEAAAVVTRTALGLGQRDPRLHQFTAETFEVRSRSGKAFAGIDGEALELDTPLEFRIAPARAAHARARRRAGGGGEAPLARLQPRRAAGDRPGPAVEGGRRRRAGAGRQGLRPVTGRSGSAALDGQIAVAAVGFDLGETLYHYARAPLSWIERTRPAVDRLVLVCGLDRSKADIAAAHVGMASYSAYLRERIEKTTREDVLTDVLTRLGGRTARRVGGGRRRCLHVLPHRRRGVSGRRRHARHAQTGRLRRRCVDQRPLWHAAAHDPQGPRALGAGAVHRRLHHVGRRRPAQATPGGIRVARRYLWA